MQLPSIMEFKIMFAQRDYRTMFSWLFAVFMPIIIYSLYPDKGIGYSLLFELPIVFIIALARADFEIKFDDAVDKCYKEILHEHYETLKPIIDVANKNLSNPKLNKEFVKRVSAKIDSFKKEENDRLHSFIQSPY